MCCGLCPRRRAREGENGRSVLPGVSNAAVRAMEGSFMKRLQWEARSGDTAGASRMLAGEGRCSGYPADGRRGAGEPHCV